MPIFHNPNCLYADPIRYCLCAIYSLQLFIHGSVNYSTVRVLYIQPKVHVVTTGIFSLGCIYLQIILVEFDDIIICKS